MARITTEYKGDMLFETSIGRHTLAVDVSPDQGGSDRAVYAPQMFVTSLASCVAILVTEYCNSHNIDASGLTVDVDYDWGDGRMENFRATVNLPNAEVGKRERAVKHAAKHCPVHATISSMDHMDIAVKDRSALVEAI